MRKKIRKTVAQNQSHSLIPSQRRTAASPKDKKNPFIFPYFVVTDHFRPPRRLQRSRPFAYDAPSFTS